MRELSFEKEPTFRAIEATAIWGSLISAGASLVGGAMGADAAKDAGKKQYAATKQQLELQRQQNELLKGYLSPYYQRGNKADAYLDAMLYGEGYMGGAGADPSMTRNMEDVLREQNPGIAAAWDRWEANDKGKPNGHRALYGDFEGYIKKAYPDRIKRAQATLQAESAPGAATGGTKITRDAAYQNLQETLPWQFNEEDFAQREALNEADYLAAQGFTEDEIAAWVANAEAEQDKSLDAIFNRGGITGQVGATRRGVAQVGEEFARDRAQYEAGRRRADYDPYSRRRATNYDTYAGGRLSAYGGYLDQLGRDSDRGFDAGTRIASGGQTYANNAGRLIGEGARAQAEAGYNAAKSWGEGLQGAVGYLGDAWSGRNGSASRSHSTSPSYSDDDSYGSYHETPTGYTAPRLRSSKQSSIYGAGMY